MSLSYNFITGLQRDIADLLANDEAMLNVHVIREGERSRPGGVSLEKAVTEALAGKATINGKSGLALIVFTPEGRPAMRSNTGIVADFEITVRAVENSSLNASREHGAGMSCEDLIVEAMLILQNWTPLRGHTLTIQEFYRQDLDNPNLWAWECIVKAHDAQAARPKVAIPQITGGPSFSISCGTPNALIYYTVDGTLPTPKTGTLYEAAVPLSEGVTLRAMAWLEGYLPSDCATTYT